MSPDKDIKVALLSIYREDGKILSVDKNQLPVELPEDPDFSISGNPLDSLKMEILQCRATGLNAIRETDTLDTFLIHLGIVLNLFTKLEKEPFNEKEVSYWIPVDHYIGGIEHAILHLLYSRFFPGR